MKRVHGFVFIGALGIAGCSKASSNGGLPPPPGTMTPDGTGSSALTFHKDVEPIFQDHCQGCHRQDGIAPFPLMTYADAKPWAAQIALYTMTRKMPPWGEAETDRCQPRFGFANDPRLTVDQVKTISDWVTGGVVEGDPAAAPPPKAVPDLSKLSRVDVSLQPDQEWVTSGTRDQFRCFVLDPKWTTAQYVNGASFVSGNTKVTHHAIAYLDPRRESLSKVDPQTGGYDCFGGPGVSDTSVLFAWAPGVPPAELGSQVALQVPANALIVLQIHYHPLASNMPEHDRSTLDLRIADARPPYIMEILLIGNFAQPFANGDGLLPGPDDRNGTPEFFIPAGARGHTESMQYTLPSMTAQGFPIPALKVLSVGTHMHYVGTDMFFRFDHATPKAGEPASECMLETPNWDFHWQRGYAYDATIDSAPEWRPGDKLFMQCTYDNSLENPAVQTALSEQGLSMPRDVVLGEQTLDEMCLSVISIAFQNPY
jgi:hypothetical protein